MGFFDANCAITGVSLQYSEAVLVPLRRLRPGVYRPIALPMTGQYDRLGGIDLPETANTDLIATFFSSLNPRRFAVTCGGARSGNRIEDVMDCLEINTTQWLGHLAETGRESLVSLDGDPIVYTLIAREVWAAISSAADASLADLPVGELLGEIAEGNPVLDEIYGGHLDQVDTEVRELSAVDRFLKDRTMLWQTHVEAAGDFGAQQTQDDQQLWLTWAYDHHGADPVLRLGLDAHAAEIERELREEEATPS